MRPDEGLRRLEALGFAPERAGALWESRNEPNPREVNAILERVQGPQRAALNRFRGRE